MKCGLSVFNVQLPFTSHYQTTCLVGLWMCVGVYIRACMENGANMGRSLCLASDMILEGVYYTHYAHY